MRRLTLAILLIGGLLAVACGGSAAADKPPSITYGRDTCDYCRMLISESRFASGLVDAKGNQRVFDDIGDMLAVLQQEGVGDQRVWVHDYHTAEWIDGTAAAYAVTHDLVTPMGSGLVAFQSREAAEEFMEEHDGTIMAWEEVLHEFQPHHGHVGH